MPASYTRVTLLARWQTEVQDTGGVYATSSIGYDLISEAMQDWCEFARMRRTNWAMDMVGNQSVYSLTSLTPRCIEPLRWSCPTSSDATDDRGLEPVSSQAMDKRYPNWRSDSASWPHIVIRDVQGPQSFRLYPTPSSSQEAEVRAGTIVNATTTGALIDITGMTVDDATALVGATIDIQYLVGSLQIYGISGPTEISADATTVETACGISPDFQDALLWHMTARFCEMDVPIAQTQKAPSYWAKWQDELARAKRLDQSGLQPRPATSSYGSAF